MTHRSTRSVVDDSSSRRKAKAAPTLVLAVLTLWIVGYEINVLWGAGPAHSVIFGRAAYEVVLQIAGLLCMLRGIAHPKERAAWVMIGLGCMVWGAGDSYYQLALADLKNIPALSLADGGWLSFYPLVFIGVMMLFRARSGRASAAQWLDGLTAALAAAALSAAVALDAVLRSLGGITVSGATTLAYPVGDLLLLGLIVGAVAVCGLRGGTVWLWLALGITVFCIADGLYLVGSVQDTYQFGTWFDIGWPGGMILLAAAAWTSVPQSDARVAMRPHGLRPVLLPMVFAVISIGLLLYTGSARLNWAARLLAAASLGVVLVRLALTFSDYTKVTELREHESKTDALTGLANRRALNADLAALLARVSDYGTGTLAIFDLDGFKHYNDTFGHPAGDALLARLGVKLGASVSTGGRAYRMGGDEFCILIEGVERFADAAVALAGIALTEIGDGFAVTNSRGVVQMPSEASSAEAALQMADERLYSRKGAGRSSATRQSRDVLLQTLREHTPELGDHTAGVRELAEAVARRLGGDEAEVELVGNTADLHDIGKVAIPRAILDKPRPLDAEEWGFMRRHTIIGERILSAAPALLEVGAAVRATHERWDGAGYPDRVGGSDIPLAARVVAVCDAFDAMIADRPYADSRSTREAVRELKRCAGSQFDPAVVAAFEQVFVGRLDALSELTGLVDETSRPTVIAS
ncbi:MAG: hypothetical protein QOD66_4 [Solirubrobacteraceae bacterium]|nr:hypothetical protein [Solirubrobacteraceae bacterium]